MHAMAHKPNLHPHPFGWQGQQNPTLRDSAKAKAQFPPTAGSHDIKLQVGALDLTSRAPTSDIDRAQTPDDVAEKAANSSQTHAAILNPQQDTRPPGRLSPLHRVTSESLSIATPLVRHGTLSWLVERPRTPTLSEAGASKELKAAKKKIGDQTEETSSRQGIEDTEQQKFLKIFPKEQDVRESAQRKSIINEEEKSRKLKRVLTPSRGQDFINKHPRIRQQRARQTIYDVNRLARKHQNEREELSKHQLNQRRKAEHDESNERNKMYSEAKKAGIATGDPQPEVSHPFFLGCLIRGAPKLMIGWGRQLMIRQMMSHRNNVFNHLNVNSVHIIPRRQKENKSNVA
ncbi:MAG: hypothetical protein MK524_08675 [SAR202 cluster bacterium]|nr:hypothetical protein [SAR202 cluster bacterium]